MFGIKRKTKKDTVQEVFLVDGLTSSELQTMLRVAYLYYDKELSQKEVAAELGLTTFYVKEALTHYAGYVTGRRA